jgi:Fe-S-cluster-containing hydrogenase component 2
MLDDLEMPASNLDVLLQRLRDQGFQIFGPTVRNNAILLREIHSTADFPQGVRDEQGAGSYQLKTTDEKSYFSFNLGPDSWRSHLLPKATKLFTGEKMGDAYSLHDVAQKVQKQAFFGIRACELQAIAVQDKVFMGTGVTQPIYKQQREDTVFIALNCTTAAATCFCPSFGINAEARSGFDVVLTEVYREDRHYFVVVAGTDFGQQLISGLGSPLTAKGNTDRQESIGQALKSITRNIDEKQAAKDLKENKNHPHWDRVAERCLSCANCTLVCPTCFCTTVTDTTDLSGNHTERWLSWDSCFTGDHSYIHDNKVHGSTKSRYRQWLTHKISSWYDQFETSGCVGCGRCIAWCPAGIDLTEEVKQLAVREA